MKTDKEILKDNAHISSEDIMQDIAETEKEVVQMTEDIAYFEKTPHHNRDYRWNHMRLEHRKSGIKEREEFIKKLEHLLELRGVT